MVHESQFFFMFGMFICINVCMYLFLLGALRQVMFVNENWFSNILPGKIKVHLNLSRNNDTLQTDGNYIYGK